MKLSNNALPSGQKFSLNLNLNHPTLLPGVQVITESTLYQGGKLFRPRLCFLMAEAVGLPLDSVAPFARIAEMVHGATLAHDDVIDEATKRRSKATLNSKVTQARAVLAGDLMLSRAMVELCELGHTAILKRMSEVLEDLVTGEWLQLENRGVLSIHSKSLETIAGYKTASMVEWCTEVPLHVLGADSDAIRYARKFGYSLGLAFQAKDDCLDFSKLSGKAFSQDLSEGLLNQVTYQLITKDPSLSTYFESVMNQEILLDYNSFVKQVGEAPLALALATIQANANRHLEVARESLLRLEKSLEATYNFQYLYSLLDEVTKREN